MLQNSLPIRRPSQLRSLQHHRTLARTPRGCSVRRPMKGTAAANASAGVEGAVERAQSNLEKFLAEVRATTIINPPPGPPLHIADPFTSRNQGQPQPAASSGESQSPVQEDCMIMIFPGALLTPPKYKALAAAISQTASAKYSSSGLRCWVAIAGVELLQLLPVLGELEALEQPGAPPGSSPLPTAEALAPMIFKEVIKLAVDQHGFKEKPSMASGRATNVLIAPHSAAGLYFGDAAVKHAGGLALLGSTWSSDVLGKMAIAGGFLAVGRPTMMLTGELDGQMAWPYMLPYAAQSAWCALRQGATHAIVNKPVILLPGVNHAQMCGSEPNLGRGDCVPDNTEAQAVETAADCLAAFLVMHFLPRPPQPDSKASNQQQHGKQPAGPHSNWPRPPSAAAAAVALGMLQRGVHWTVNALMPYAAATGYGDLRGSWIRAVSMDQAAAKWEDAWEGPQMPPDPSNPSSIAALDSMLPPPFGMAPNTGVPSTATNSVWGAPPPPGPAPVGTMPSRTFGLGPMSSCIPGLPPGMVMAAERGAAEAQMCVAGGAVASGLLPPAALGRVRVVAHVHPTLNGFLYSQPTVRSLPGGRAEVAVQCFQHFPALDRSSSTPSGLYPASPDLWLKMKSGMGLTAELRHELGLPSLAAEGKEKQGAAPQDSPPAAAAQALQGAGTVGVAGTEEGAVTAVDVNRAALEWALQQAPEDMRKRYLARGVPLEFGEDQVASSPPSWVKDTRLQFQVLTGGGATGDKQGAGSIQPKAVRVHSPVLRGVTFTDVSKLGAEERRFTGSLYIKVMSKAMALEWVCLGGIRQASQGDRCMWGGH